MILIFKRIPEDKVASYNFDHPDSLDFDLCYEVLKKLAQKEDAEIPIYNFTTHSRESQWEKVQPSDVILFEGILALHDQVTFLLTCILLM